MLVHTDCRQYRGDLPCKPHKREGVHCDGCAFYEPTRERILIIKLGAIGDVIRTTPILRRLKAEYPDAAVHWMTHTPEVVPGSVDRVYLFRAEDLETVKATPYDFLFNLDKDREACALANVVQAKEKKGFVLKDGQCWPLDEPARRKWITGLFDDETRKNDKSYPREIFEICGFEYEGEEYILDAPPTREWTLPEGQTVIGLNTGCGSRWRTRLWPEPYWIDLAKRLVAAGYTVIFLGGEQEHEKNRRLSKASGAQYLGHFPLPVFMDLVNQCHLIVTAVTMALHIAIGLKKKIVLFNNIFNRHEFELYGRGIILEPDKECKGCYLNDCEESCMDRIKPDAVFESVNGLNR
ncbi:MAG TPA: glycosyltransferase family 9 protein [bacterium]